MSILKNSLSYKDREDIQRMQKNFLLVHFAGNKEYEAFVTQYCKHTPHKTRKKGKTAATSLYPFGSISTKKICELKEHTYDLNDEQALDQMIEQKAYRRTYYIGCNGMKSPMVRDRKSLFTYNNVVIDIDCHFLKKEDPAVRDRLLDELHYALLDNSCNEDAPNTIVWTGRGLQLWYAIEPVSYKMKKQYDFFRTALFRNVQECINQTSIPEMLSIDMGASKNDAGLFRFPGTFNTKTGTYSKVEILHDYRTNIAEFFESSKMIFESKYGVTIEKHKKKKLAAKKKKSSKPDPKNFDPEMLAKDREKMITKLVSLRQKNGLHTGFRDFALLIVHSAYVSTGHSDECSMDAALRLNEVFSHPMPIKEIVSVLSSSAKKGYRFGLRKIADILDISDDEAAEIGLNIRGTKREMERAEKREVKKNRNKEILKFFVEGRTQEWIASKLSCSQSTVSRVIRRASNQDLADAAEQNSQEDISNVPEDVRSGQAQTKEDSAITTESICDAIKVDSEDSDDMVKCWQTWNRNQLTINLLTWVKQQKEKSGIVEGSLGYSSHAKKYSFLTSYSWVLYARGWRAASQAAVLPDAPMPSVEFDPQLEAEWLRTTLTAATDATRGLPDVSLDGVLSVLNRMYRRGWRALISERHAAAQTRRHPRDRQRTRKKSQRRCSVSA